MGRAGRRGPARAVQPARRTFSLQPERRLSVAFALLVFCANPSFGQILPLPPRPADAPGRNQIIEALSPLSRDIREDSLFRYVMSGNVPSFMRSLVPVTSSAIVGGSTVSVTYHVTPDYLAVGSDSAYFLSPMTPVLAQRLADALQCTLPTRKMVDAIYAAAPLKLDPAPIAPSAEMITVPVFVQHDSMVWAQRTPGIPAFPLGTLVGGTKKDVVISNKIRFDLRAGVPKPVVIYGWHRLNGVPIQPLYNGHGETYADYSHGIRLVQQAVELDGSTTSVSAILQDSSLSAILSDEGPIPFPRYGNPPTDVQPESEPEGSLFFQNYPNPFNPKTVVRFTLPAAADVHLRVYDSLGREVALLAEGEKAAGTYDVEFVPEGIAGGVYFCTLATGREVRTRKLLLLR